MRFLFWLGEEVNDGFPAFLNVNENYGGIFMLLVIRDNQCGRDGIKTHNCGLDSLNLFAHNLAPVAVQWLIHLQVTRVVNFGHHILSSGFQSICDDDGGLDYFVLECSKFSDETFDRVNKYGDFVYVSRHDDNLSLLDGE
jgi:hypothetical protein